MPLSSQAKTLSVVYMLLFLLMMGIIVYFGALSFGMILPVLIWIALIALMVYDTNCLTAGECGVWSWIRTIIFTLIPILMIVLIVFVLSSGSMLLTAMKFTSEEHQNPAYVTISQ